MSAPPEDSRIVEAHGARSIAIGGDALNSLLVTGDNNVFFVGRYERLVDAYLNPRALYQELALDAFTGRRWLVAAVDRFLTTHDRGYLVIEADAGMGKSTFLAWIARERGYAHHFVRLMPDPQDIAVAVKNLAAQLIRAWNVESRAIGGVLPPSAGRPDFLHDLLFDAAARRDELRPGEPIVLVVDGLNETVPPAGQNPLGLPGALPAGVYVVTSQRPVQVPLRVTVPRAVITIDADGEDNMNDVHDYLRYRAESAEIRSRLQAAGVSSQGFVDTLLAKSGGVWIYLHYVLAEIARGTRSPGDVDQLPTGLWHFYAQYWHEWQRSHEERWAELDLPLLCLVGAAAEPLPARLLAELTGVGRTTMIETLLEDDWRPFMQVDETAEENRYQVFHDSLKEFLHGEVDAGELTAAERSLANRLARATRSAHALIADRYLNAWGGLHNGLPALREGVVADLDGSYGLRHVVEHLGRAGRSDDLHALMTLSWTNGARPTNVWFSVHRSAGLIAGYQRDLSTAWNVARHGTGSRRCALQLRYALITCSLNSLAAATPPTSWAILVQRGRLSPEAALTHARQVPTAEERAEALTGLIEVVPGRLRDQTEREALAAVRTVPDGFWRVGELWRLHSHVSPKLRGELLAIVRSLGDPYYQVVASRLLGIEEGVPTLSPRRGAGFEQDLESASGLAGSGEFVAAYLRRRQFAASRLQRAGLAVAGHVPEDSVERYWMAHLLAMAVTELPGEPVSGLAAAAVEMGEEIGDRRDVLAAWGSLGAALALLAGDAGQVPLDVSRRIADPSQQTAFLLNAAIRPEMADPEVEQMATEALGQVDGDGQRASVLLVAAPAVARCGLERIGELAGLVGDRSRRIDVMLAVAPLATPPVAEQIGAQVLAMLAAAPDLAGHAGLLSRAAAFLPTASLSTALKLAGALINPDARSAAVAAVGIRFGELGQLEQATDVLASVAGTWRTFLVRALADAHARSGDPQQALRLAAELPYVSWRAEVLARAAHRLQPAAADAVVAAVLDEAGVLEPPAMVPILASATAAAPVSHQPELMAAALAGLQDIEERHERAVALRAVAETLVSLGDAEGALSIVADIPVDRVRADVLGALLDSTDPHVVRTAVAQADTLADQEARARVRVTGLGAAVRVLAAGDPGASSTAALGPSFDAALNEFATLSRSEFLSSLPHLLAAAAYLDGPSAVPAAAADLADVVSWWP